MVCAGRVAEWIPCSGGGCFSAPWPGSEQVRYAHCRRGWTGPSHQTCAPPSLWPLPLPRRRRPLRQAQGPCSCHSPTGDAAATCAVAEAYASLSCGGRPIRLLPAVSAPPPLSPAKPDPGRSSFFHPPPVGLRTSQLAHSAAPGAVYSPPSATPPSPPASLPAGSGAPFVGRPWYVQRAFDPGYPVAQASLTRTGLPCCPTWTAPALLSALPPQSHERRQLYLLPLRYRQVDRYSCHWHVQRRPGQRLVHVPARSAVQLGCERRLAATGVATAAGRSLGAPHRGRAGAGRRCFSPSRACARRRNRQMRGEYHAPLTPPS